MVPCHNYGRFLPEALASLDAQTRQPDETVIVDDGSTDNTSEIVAAWARLHPDARVISRSPARGIVATLNDAVLVSTGDLIVGLSADDRFSAAYIEQMEKGFDDPSVGFVYGETRMFGAVHATIPAQTFSARALAVENPYNGSSMFRRDAFDRAGGFESAFETIGYEDWEFWLRIVGAGYVGASADGCWLDYRRHPEGSRNTVSHRVALEVHLRIWRRNRPAVRAVDVGRWAARSVARNARRRLG